MYQPHQSQFLLKAPDRWSVRRSLVFIGLASALTWGILIAGAVL